MSGKYSLFQLIVLKTLIILLNHLAGFEQAVTAKALAEIIEQELEDNKYCEGS